MDIETFYNTDDLKRFYFPGKIILGKGASERVTEFVMEYKSVLAVIDKEFKDSLLHKSLLANAQGVEVVTWVVEGPPFVQNVERCVAQLKGAPELIISVGGGSSADFAKAIILTELFGTVDGVGVGEKRGIEPRAGTKKPIYIAVPTTAGSGAESSRYYVNYDQHTHGKVYGKTWTTVADWVFLDPDMLSSMPTDSLVSCAFDAFVHLFESFIAQHERSVFGEMLSLDGIPRIMSALNSILFDGVRTDKTHEQLLYAATIAGVGISNVRTGNIHEAAGALLELCDLNHPETLFVFFHDAVDQYFDAIQDREKLLLLRLKMLPQFNDFTTLRDVVQWWERVFDKVGLVSKIRDSIRNLHSRMDEVRPHIFNRVYTDKVWITKESPVVLDEATINDLISKSFGRFLN